MVLHKRAEELSVQLAQIQEEKEQLQQVKVCLTVVHQAFSIEYAVLSEFMSTRREQDFVSTHGERSFLFFLLSLSYCTMCVIYNSISESLSINIPLSQSEISLTPLQWPSNFYLKLCYGMS